MKEIFPHHVARMFVYMTLSVLSICSIYTVYFATDAQKRTINLEKRMDVRERVAAEYVPRLEKTEALTLGQEQDIGAMKQDLQSIKLRMRDMMSDYLAILKTKPIPKVPGPNLH